MKNKVFANASIVTILSTAERGLGFLYRIVLSRLIGAEGLGLYQVALSLFSIFLTIGTGGIPITVSRMISKSKADGQFQEGQRAVSAGLSACLLLTLPFAILLFFFGGKIPFLFSDARAFSVFRILLIGLTFSSVYAVIRGSFWGDKQFLAPSIMEISEEAVMVIVGVLLLQKVSSPETGAQRAAWAVVISYLFSCTLSLICFFLRGGRFSSPKATLKPLFVSAMPITAVRASTSLISSAIAVLLPVMLIRTGITQAQALQLFGVVSGMVLPILFIPSTLIGSLALVLVPELSEDFYRRNFTRLRTNLARGLKFSFLISCALIPFFFVLGDELGALAYSNAAAGEMIKYSSILLLPMSVTMITTAMLNSMGYEKHTLAFFYFGAAAMLLCILFLPAVCGVYAYLVGFGTSYALNAVCNLVLLFKKTPIYEKRRGHVFVQQYLPAIIATPLIALFGEFFHSLLQHFAGVHLSLWLAFLALCVVSILFYLATDNLPLHRIRENFRYRRKLKEK